MLETFCSYDTGCDNENVMSILLWYRVEMRNFRWNILYLFDKGWAITKRWMQVGKILQTWYFGDLYEFQLYLVFTVRMRTLEYAHFLDEQTLLKVEGLEDFLLNFYLKVCFKSLWFEYGSIHKLRRQVRERGLAKCLCF